MKTLILLFFLSIAFMSDAQETGCSFEYRHYKGLVEHDTAVMDLIILDGEIKGKILYPYHTYSHNGRECMHAERLEGELDRYQVATLESYPAEGESGAYSGTFEQIFQGTYRDDGDNRGKTFSLAENYDGSIAFIGYCVSRDTVLRDTIDSPRAKLELAVFLPEGDSVEYIRNEILQVYFRNEKLIKSRDNKILTLYCREYFNQYIEANTDIYDGGHAFDWEMSGITGISMNRNGLLVYRADNYAYTGGAHGIGISRFLVFDTYQKSRLKLADIFREEAMDKLRILLEQEYRETHYLDKDESLTDACLFDSQIIPSENFWITECSISFFYNPYELAPYAMGSITISLHSDQIEDLLLHDAPVKRLGW